MEFMKTGGVWYTIPILIMGVVSVVLIGISIINIIKKEKVTAGIKDLVLFLGFLSFALGIFGQISGMFQAAGAIVSAGEISPILVWQGLKVSLIPVIMGFVVLFVSGIGWFGLRSFGKPVVK
jgi:hypothetical protein